MNRRRFFFTLAPTALATIAVLSPWAASAQNSCASIERRVERLELALTLLDAREAALVCVAPREQAACAARSAALDAARTAIEAEISALEAAAGANGC